MKSYKSLQQIILFSLITTCLDGRGEVASFPSRCSVSTVSLYRYIGTIYLRTLCIICKLRNNNVNKNFVILSLTSFTMLQRTATSYRRVFNNITHKACKDKLKYNYDNFVYYLLLVFFVIEYDSFTRSTATLTVKQCQLRNDYD